MKTWHANLILLAFLTMCCSRGHAVGPLAIQGAQIITVSGERIENGTILIRDGKIEAVGTDIELPGEAKVIDATGKVVMPGIVDAHNAAGMSQANEQAAVVPFLSVVDSIDPVDSYFEECRRNGVTTAAVVPGNSTLIGGKAAIVKTAGEYVNDMLVRRDSGLKISLRPTSGSRMSQMAQLRKELDKAKQALEEPKQESSAEDKATQADKEDQKESEKEEDSEESAAEDDQQSAANAKAEDADEGLEALKLALQGKMPVYIYCETGMDALAACRLIDDYQLTAIFVLGRDCYKAAKSLADRHQTVILDSELVFWETNERTREDTKVVIPEVYLQAGVPFIFQTEDPSSRRTLGSSYYWYQAATAVKYGLSEAQALAAITLEPAKVLGIDSMVGSIEVGKDADLVILTGDPLDISSWVESTIVAGQIVYNRDEDKKLERLLSPAAE
jgi:imidazolonepropionase-like amidohydrolase